MKCLDRRAAGGVNGRQHRQMPGSNQLPSFPPVLSRSHRGEPSGRQGPHHPSYVSKEHVPSTRAAISARSGGVAAAPSRAQGRKYRLEPLPRPRCGASGSALTCHSSSIILSKRRDEAILCLVICPLLPLGHSIVGLDPPMVVVLSSYTSMAPALRSSGNTMQCPHPRRRRGAGSVPQLLVAHLSLPAAPCEDLSTTGTSLLFPTTCPLEKMSWIWGLSDNGCERYSICIGFAHLWKYLKISPLTPIKEDAYRKEHWVLYADNESWNTTSETNDWHKHNTNK